MNNNRYPALDKLNIFVLLFLMVTAISFTITLFSFADKEEANEQYGAPSILKEGDYYFDDFSCMDNNVYNIFNTDDNDMPIYKVYSWCDKRNDNIDNTWHIFKINTSGNGENGKLLFYDGLTVINTEEITLVDQKLYYYSEAGFNAVELWIDSEEDSDYQINSIEFREKKELFSVKTFFVRYGAIFLAILMMGVALYIAFSDKIKYLVVGLDSFIESTYQEIICFFSELSESLTRVFPEPKFGERGLSIFRIACFAFPFFGGCWPILSAENGNTYTISRFVTVISLVICSALIRLEKKQNDEKKTYAGIGKPILALALIQIISDIFVPHSHRFNGLVLILLFIYFTAVSNVRDKNKIMAEIMTACHIFILYVIWYGIFIYVPIYGEERFVGPYGSASECGISLVSFVAVVLIEMYEALRKKQKSFKQLVFYGFELLALTYYIVITDSRDSILAYGIVVAVLIAVMIRKYYVRKEQNKSVNSKSKWIRIIIAIVSVTVFMTVVVIYITLHSHNMSGLSLNRVSSERLNIWRKALSLMNFIGHEDKLYLMNKKFYIHNGIISQMYFYGVFAIVPYVYMFYAVIRRLIQGPQISDKYRIWALMFTFGYINTVMLDVQDEFPFIRCGYLLFIYLVGFLL